MPALRHSYLCSFIDCRSLSSNTGLKPSNTTLFPTRASLEGRGESDNDDDEESEGSYKSDGFESEE